MGNVADYGRNKESKSPKTGPFYQLLLITHRVVISGAANLDLMDESVGYDLLLVEDNPADVNLFRIAFEKCDIPGYLHVATTGEEALSLLRIESSDACATTIDLIILDLNLPDTSGLKVLEELKHDSPLQSTPILILSTSTDPDDIHKALELGANAYLVKRMDFEETVALVNALDEFWFNAAVLPD